MKTLLKLAPIPLALIALSGCISQKTYLDPQFGGTRFQDIKPVQQKYNAVVRVQFLRNGERLPAVDAELSRQVERSFRASGVIIPDSLGDVLINVSCNNIADIGSGAAKGFGTGLTLGLIGSTVADYYDITITASDRNGVIKSGTYKHALYTTVGNKGAPFPGVIPMNVGEAFSSAVEQVVLTFIKEMQDNGKFSLVHRELRKQKS
jgi:hypothetical protein